MKLFSLKFQDPNIEAEYRETRMPLTKNFLKHLIVVMLFFVIYSIIAAVTNQRAYIPNMNVVLLIATLFLLKYHDKFKNIMEPLVVLISIILYGIGLKAIRIFFKDNFNPIVFYLGYNCALFQRLIETRLVRGSSPMILYLGFFILRITIISDFTTSALLIQILLETLLIISNVERERNIRKLFRSFYDYKQNLFKFKDLMTNYFPENIVIFNKDFTKTLFTNQNFQKSFSCSNIEDTKSFVNGLNIDQETIQDASYKTLGAFLEKFSRSSDLDNKKIATFNVRQESGKEVYQTKILKLFWDQEEAIAVIFSDLTQQETIIALRVADANKDKVIATVSHELRTPINAIIGFTKILEGMINNPDLKFYLSACKYSADWLLTLVNSILDLSQIRGNCIKLNPSSFNLGQNLEEIKRMFTFQCAQKNLELKFSLAEDLPQIIYTDKNRLNQILINLLNNALKFTYNGTITLSVQNNPQNPSHLLFQVSDTGIAIKDQDKEKLFKMYGRVDQRDNNINTQGVGLGLTISNELVRLLNPQQEISGIKFDTKFSQGTTFYFSINKSLHSHPNNIQDTSLDKSVKEPNSILLPRTKDYKFLNSVVSNAQIGDSLKYPLLANKTSSFPLQSSLFQKVPESIPETSRNLSKMSSVTSIPSTPGRSVVKPWALLVDDMPFNLIVASHILAKKGLNVKTAYNGKEAINIVNEHYNKGEEFKFILMDCQMPIMDGFEAAQVLTGLMKTRSLPEISIIAFSANNSKRDVDRAFKSGMKDFLFKPFEEEQFNKIISSQNIKF